MWHLYQQAKTWGVLPSDLLGLERGSYQAYCFNQVVFFYGSAVMAEVEGIPWGKNDKPETMAAKRERALRKMLSLETGDQAGRFRDPASKF
jgi:hypothetical protein